LLDRVIQFFQEKPDTYLEAVGTHLRLSALCVLVACAVGIPLGIVCVRSRRLRAFVTGVFATLRIIPSLAVLMLCLPVFGIGATSALIALSLLAIPPVLINTTLAFGSLPAPVLETAAGLGMGRARTFFLVKLPLAAPLVLAGVRTALVEVIASATLAAYIGAGGLGVIIYTGLELLRADLLLIGGVTVAALSIAADSILGAVERHVFVRYRNV
jgi:osmoprotectant transport system permease protein